jgi:hypothetical protein
MFIALKLAAWSWSAWVRQALFIEGFVVFVYRMEIVLWGTMPYLTNNQRLDLGLEGACCVKDDTLKAKKPANYYVQDAPVVAKKKTAKKEEE